MFIHFLRFQRLYEGDSGGGGGTGSDPAEGFKKLLEKHNNDALRVADLLHGENFKERERNRTLNEQIAALQGKVPGEGAVVLDSAAATQWQALSALGDATTIQAAIAERDTAKTELTTLKQDLALRDVAQVAKYDLDVLRTLGGNLSYAIKETTVNGKAEKQVVIKDGEKETPIGDYAKAQWGKFLPALQLAPERPVIGSPATRFAQTPPAADPAQPRKPLARL